MTRKMKLRGQENKTAVFVGTVTEDVWILEVPKLKVCALQVSSQAQGRGHCAPVWSLDGLRGVPTFWEGTPHSPTKPYVHSKGQKFEGTRGQRTSRGYKT
jgi:large subunit ribosomal protein L18e